MVAILGYSPQQITEAVQEMYTSVAEKPSSPFHFPVGKAALDSLGYDTRDTTPLPDNVAASFAGVGNPFNAQALQPGDTAMDVGAGAGNDSLIAGKKVGPDGKVIALDLTAAMTRKIRHNTAGRCPNIGVVQASAEQLPLASGSIDCITSNGALNLVPDKRLAIREMFRVLRPGGRLQMADVVISRPVNVNCDSDPRLWVECVVGATVEESLVAMLGDAGFEDIRILRRLDYFAHSPSQQTREIAQSFGAHSIELSARRADQAPGRWQQWLRRLHPKRWLATLGTGRALDPGLWAGTIALFTSLATVFIATGIRHHRSFAPTALAILGSLLILYAQFVDYHAMTELTGFIMLVGAAARDLVLRRREEAQRLGLGSRRHI